MHTDHASPQSHSTAGLPLPSSSSESKLALGAEPRFNKQQQLQEGELSSSCSGPITQLLCPETFLPFLNKVEISSPISFEPTHRDRARKAPATGILERPCHHPATMTMPPPLPPRHSSHAKAPRSSREVCGDACDTGCWGGISAAWTHAQDQCPPSHGHQADITAWLLHILGGFELAPDGTGKRLSSRQPSMLGAALFHSALGQAQTPASIASPREQSSSICPGCCHQLRPPC